MMRIQDTIHIYFTEGAVTGEGIKTVIDQTYKKLQALRSKRVYSVYSVCVYSVKDGDVVHNYMLGIRLSDHTRLGKFYTGEDVKTNNPEAYSDYVNTVSIVMGKANPDKKKESFNKLGALSEDLEVAGIDAAKSAAQGFVEAVKLKGVRVDKPAKEMLVTSEPIWVFNESTWIEAAIPAKDDNRPYNKTQSGVKLKISSKIKNESTERFARYVRPKGAKPKTLDDIVRIVAEILDGEHPESAENLSGWGDRKDRIPVHEETITPIKFGQDKTLVEYVVKAHVIKTEKGIKLEPHTAVIWGTESRDFWNNGLSQKASVLDSITRLRITDADYNWITPTVQKIKNNEALSTTEEDKFNEEDIVMDTKIDFPKPSFRVEDSTVGQLVKGRLRITDADYNWITPTVQKIKNNEALILQLLVAYYVVLVQGGVNEQQARNLMQQMFGNK